MAADKRRKGFWPLAFVFGLFVLFLYGPVITIFVLSFQGPEGGLTFPMRGWSMHWYGELWKGLGVVDIGAALRRSLALGVVVMLLTVTISVSAGQASVRFDSIEAAGRIGRLGAFTIFVSAGQAYVCRVLTDPGRHKPPLSSRDLAMPVRRSTSRRSRSAGLLSGAT